jgi:putative transposase
MIELGNGPLSIRRQCHFLGISRNRIYRPPRLIPIEELRMMEHIDKLHLEDPSAGARKIARYLERDGFGVVSRRRARRMMRQMGIDAVYPRKRTTIPDGKHRRYPYLLKNLVIERSDQVWCSDITYLPMRRGFMYLVVIMDWYSRKVITFELSNTLDTEFCMRVLGKAVETTGSPPEIMNTDQGCQYTSDEWTGFLKNRGVSISMDGKGRWIDNIVVERFWRSLKYEDIYLECYEDGRSLERGLVLQYIKRHTQRRVHQSLGYATPDECYYGEDWKNRRDKAA